MNVRTVTVIEQKGVYELYASTGRWLTGLDTLEEALSWVRENKAEITMESAEQIRQWIREGRP